MIELLQKNSRVSKKYILDTRQKGMIMNIKSRFQKIIDYITDAIQEAGYDPYEQLCAYAVTGNDAFITRKSHARTLISKVDRLQLMEYLSKKQ